MGNNFCYEQNYYPITAPTVSTDTANLTLKLSVLDFSLEMVSVLTLLVNLSVTWSDGV